MPGDVKSSSPPGVARAILAAFAAAVVAACSSAATPMHQPSAAGSTAGLAAVRDSAPKTIQHVVIIIQENRTPDNLFNGFPGADTVNIGYRHDGTKVQLQPVSMTVLQDVCHSHHCSGVAYNGGQMNGFDLYNTPNQSPTFPYAVVPRTESVPYWTMAAQYAFGDRTFQSNTGPSYPAHQYLVSAQSADVVDNPSAPGGVGGIWGCDSPSGTTTVVMNQFGQLSQGPFPCFDYTTLADEMDKHGISWRYYATAIGNSGGQWSAFDAIRHLRYGSDWHANVVSPESQILTDIAGGYLAQVSWVTPNKKNSDHAGSGSASGPQWVASIVNAIGNSRFWRSTAIVVVWDDWGGWYDHVPPQQLDNMGLGIRVPLIVISPFAKTGYVSHQQHEFGSILKFTEQTFGLSALTQVDSRADNLSDCFNFGAAPRPFVTIPTAMKPADFVNQVQTHETPDD